MPPRPAPETGLTLQITRLLERGARAHVYVVEATGRLTGPLALKWLQDRGWEARARFADEGALLLGLRHPMVPAGHLQLELEGRPAILMELGVGVTARELLQARGPLSPPAALELCAQLARVLDDLHNASLDGRKLKLVHRDLKTEDVLVRADGSVMLLTLGSARADLEGREMLTAGLYRGDPRRAPSVAKNAPGFDPTIDTFEIGLFLLELVLGDLEAFPEGLSPADLHARVARLGGLPVELRQLVTEMTAESASARPRPGQVIDRLRAMAAAAPGERLVERASRLVDSVQQARIAQGTRASGLVGAVLVEQPDGTWKRRAAYLDAVEQDQAPEPVGPSDTELVRQAVRPRPAPPAAPPRPAPPPPAPAPAPAAPPLPWGVAVAAVVAGVMLLGALAIWAALLLT